MAKRGQTWGKQISIPATCKEFDLGWIVALIEGEGSISTHGLHKRTPQIGITQKDRAVLDVMVTRAGGAVYTQGKANYQWMVSGEKARKLAAMIRSHLSERRQNQMTGPAWNLTK